MHRGEKASIASLPLTSPCANEQFQQFHYYSGLKIKSVNYSPYQVCKCRTLKR